jgi:hypothetical protein
MSRTCIARTSRAVAVAAAVSALAVPAAQAKTITYSARHVPAPAAIKNHHDGTPEALPLLVGIGVLAASGAGASAVRARSVRRAGAAA